MKADMKTTRWAFSILATAMTLAAGCDPVASDDYQGKVLATLHTVVAPAALPAAAEPTPAIPSLELAAVWGRLEGNSVKFIAEKVPIVGTFPAEFTLQLHHPPPASAMWRLGGVNFSFAYLVALEKSGWQTGKVLEIGRSVKSFGMSDEVILYMDRTVAADDPFAAVFGVQQAGFHLVHSVEMTAEKLQAWTSACLKLLPADACKLESVGGSGSGSGSGMAGTNGTTETTRYGLAEVPEGLAHVIKLDISPFPNTIEGGDQQTPTATPSTTLSNGAVPPATQP